MNWDHLLTAAGKSIMYMCVCMQVHTVYMHKHQEHTYMFYTLTSSAHDTPAIPPPTTA